MFTFPQVSAKSVNFSSKANILCAYEKKFDGVAIELLILFEKNVDFKALCKANLFNTAGYLTQWIGNAGCSVD